MINYILLSNFVLNVMFVSMLTHSLFLGILASMGWISAFFYRMAYVTFKQHVEESKLTPSQKVDKILENFDRYDK